MLADSSVMILVFIAFGHCKMTDMWLMHHMLWPVYSPAFSGTFDYLERWVAH